ncbi:MAG: ion transporter [Candidatus Rokuibacteriota bacterium]
MTGLARRISENHHFHTVVLGVIVLTAVTVGLETYPALIERQAGLFTGLDWAIQTFFVLEIAIRLVACWPRPLRFFADGWNVFDFVSSRNGPSEPAPRAAQIAHGLPKAPRAARARAP